MNHPQSKALPGSIERFRAIGCILSVLLFAACAGTKARPNSLPPSSSTAVADPPPVTDGDVTIAFVNGIKVLIKRTPNAEFVASQLNIRGGVRNWGSTDCGIEHLALAVAASGGTRELNKDAFTRRLSASGATLTTGSENDFSAFRAKSLKQDWEETFRLMVDSFLNPALPASEVELQRQRQLSELRHELEDPDSEIRMHLQQTLFKGHPYENRSVGKLEVVAKLSVEQLNHHLAKLREASRLLLVVIGDVEPARVIEQVRAALGSLPRGNYQEQPLPSIQPKRAQLTLIERPLATNYILGAFPAPRWRDADFPAALAAMATLDAREWIEIRSKRNLSYAPHAGLAFHISLPQAYLYVTAVDPNTTFQVMFDEARKMRVDLVPAPELKGNVAVFTTGQLMEAESTDGQASELSYAEILGGDWRLARNLPDRLRAVTSEDVRRFSERYLSKLQTVVMGDTKKIDPKLFSSL